MLEKSWQKWGEEVLRDASILLARDNPDLDKRRIRAALRRAITKNPDIPKPERLLFLVEHGLEYLGPERTSSEYEREYSRERRDKQRQERERQALARLERQRQQRNA